jgi:hypothetical protein
MNYPHPNTDILGDINDYMVRARQDGKNSIKFRVTQAEMDFLVEKANGDPNKLDSLNKHYEVYHQYSISGEAISEQQNKEETAYEKNGLKPPLNRADRRRLRFGKTPKPVVSEKRF